MNIMNVVQGSPEWLALRRNYLTASEAPIALGKSKYTNRSDLLLQKHTGTEKEVDAFTQGLFDQGHAAEAAARLIAEEIVGSDLYPVTATDEVDGLRLLASLDGVTMDEETIWEHKLYNAELAAAVATGTLDAHYTIQMDQQLLVSGAKKCLFMTSDGTRENMAWCWYEPNREHFDALVAGWKQFTKDLAVFELPEAKSTVVAEAVQALPVVSVQISGKIDVRENFTVFEVALREFLENKLIREPQTDQDFADLDLQIKAMKKAEETLNAAEAMMLAQIQSVDEAKRQKDMLAKLVRDNRLMAEKLLASEKERRRAERVMAAIKSFQDHVAELQREIRSVVFKVEVPDFTGAIKGLKTLASIQDKLDTALANGKIAADQQAADIRTKIDWLNANAAEYRALLADLQQLIAKPIDDFKLTVTSRIDKHKRDEEARREADRARIRREESERLEREAADKRAAEEKAAREVAEKAAKAAEPSIEATPAPSPPPTPAPKTAAAVTPLKSGGQRVKRQRPSDADIIEAVSIHFGAPQATVIEWLRDLSLPAAA
jgi:putative phage-type endonuclease